MQNVRHDAQQRPLARRGQVSAGVTRSGYRIPVHRLSVTRTESRELPSSLEMRGSRSPFPIEVPDVERAHRCDEPPSRPGRGLSGRLDWSTRRRRSRARSRYASKLLRRESGLVLAVALTREEAGRGIARAGTMCLPCAAPTRPCSLFVILRDGVRMTPSGSETPLMSRAEVITSNCMAPRDFFCTPGSMRRLSGRACCACGRSMYIVCSAIAPSGRRITTLRRER